MGRQKTIDRNEVIDAAERVITIQGVGNFSIGAVAKEAGISKGGVQSCFKTKEELISALVAKWFSIEETAYDLVAKDCNDVAGRIRAHVAISRDLIALPESKRCAVLAGLLAQDQNKGPAKDWYRKRYDNFSAESSEDRRARVAFIASEGMFYLKFLGLFDFGTDEWDDIFDDIQKVADGRL
ncbi:TetR/AcrR family transcriptional regulator [Asaia sp. HN010]|uniref:TetR/AcrR family transcriptional regulator n=1 Tax=Asaia sp. HN010 TaxID=3081233 RepID=UPI003018E3D5